MSEEQEIPEVSPQSRCEYSESRKHDQGRKASLRRPCESVRQFGSNPAEPIRHPEPGCQGFREILPIARPAHDQIPETIHPSHRRSPLDRHCHGAGREKWIAGYQDTPPHPCRKHEDRNSRHDHHLSLEEKSALLSQQEHHNAERPNPGYQSKTVEFDAKTKRSEE